jgi:hypothetical protein
MKRFLTVPISRSLAVPVARSIALSVSPSIVLAIALLALALPASAHIGSPDVFVDDHAGPYRLFVTVRVPQVIPGIAEIEIRSESNDLEQIRIAPMQLTGPGSQFPPVADVAQRSKTDSQFFTGSLWLMEFGSLQVRIDADGARGPGELSVPVPATAQRMLPMSPFLEILLAGLALLLVSALISIVAAAVREGNLAPGLAATPVTARRGRVSAVVASFVIVGILLIGGNWWKSEASRYASHIYAPPQMQVTLDDASNQHGARLFLREGPATIASGNPRRDTERSDLDNLIPDHNHLMHFFMIRTPAMDSFWHLHPEPAGLVAGNAAGNGAGNGFVVNLPAVPAGHYELYADVVLRSGFPVTMVGQIDVPHLPGEPLAGPVTGFLTGSLRGPLTGDDSGVVAHPLDAAAANTATSALPDGGQMIWERDSPALKAPLKMNVPLMFHFRVTDREGKPATDLEPYMGMAAHAEIVRSDGSVFAHVHPSGSAAMAAMEMARAAARGNPQIGTPGEPSVNATSPMGMPAMAGMAMPATGTTNEHVDPEISFPYGFPKPGLYRIFVQVKRAGKIETGVFDATVE